MRLGLGHLLSSSILWMVLLAIARPALGQCPLRFDELLTFPDDGETDVPTNVVVRVEFPTARSASETADWTVTDDDGTPVEGQTYWDGLTATFTPEEELEPRRAYSYTLNVGLEEIGSFSFTTGDGSDDSRPRFGGVRSMSWVYRTAEWLQNECSSYRGGGHVFTLELDQVADDTESDELCYHVYRTAGPDLSGPRLEARTRLGGDSLVLFVPEGAGDGRYCFHVEVQDLAGRFDTNDEEICLDVVAKALFGNICSVAAPTTGSSRAGLLLVTSLALALFVRRHGRRRG